MLRPPCSLIYIFHKKGSNYYNLSANICFLYKISSSSTDLSINCLEKNLWCPMISNCSGYGLKCPIYLHQIMHQKTIKFVTINRLNDHI